MLDVEFRHWLGVVQNCNNNWGRIKLKYLLFSLKKKKKALKKKGKKAPIMLFFWHNAFLLFHCCVYIFYVFIFAPLPVYIDWFEK